ncbi:MAG: cation diffusion facilitator family transporter [Sporomusa sp.]|jgi:cation diffusion facilitator family transporter|nr:cation diffusion facilitator family transporter [Sporomusa sp.]
MDENGSILKQSISRISVISAMLLLVLKLVAGILTGSISILSEAIHSAMDLLAALVAYCAIRKSAISADDDHHYGHGKFENLSGAVEALFIVLAAIWILFEACGKLYYTSNPPEFLGYGIIAMLVSTMVNYWVSHKLITVAKQTNSPALEADGLHLQADVWTSNGVLIGLLVMQLTRWPWIDAVIAVIVSFKIFNTGYLMLKKNIAQLTDTSLPKEEQQLITEIVTCHEQVNSLQRVRTRYSGGCRLIDMQIGLDKNMHLDRAHAICNQLEISIKQRLGQCEILNPMKEKQSTKPDI